jgi:hypothetical protein
MKKLAQSDLYTLEAYAQERTAMRARVLAHKQVRKVHVGAHVTLIFEDRLTIQYQVQEMLRVERIFEAACIRDELDAYNPLIPDGHNLKATMLIEYPDENERVRRLVELHDIEHRIGMQVGDMPPVIAIADEDMDRSTENKTSAVHFLRFEFDTTQIAEFKRGANVVVAIDHPAYRERIYVDAAARTALASDFD